LIDLLRNAHSLTANIVVTCEVIRCRSHRRTDLRSSE